MSEGKGSRGGFDPSVFIKAAKLATDTQDYVKVKIFDAVVQSGSIDEDNFTCVVDSVDSTINNLQVRYHLCVSDGEINTPEDGSTVTIAKTAFTDPYIVKSTDLKSKVIAVGNQVYSNDGNVQAFYFYKDKKSEFGGIPKVIDTLNPTQGLLKKINNLEEDLNSLKSDYTQLLSIVTALNTVLSGLGGAPVPASALAPFFTGFITAFQQYSIDIIKPTTQSEIENPNIIHGLKLNPNG